MVRMACRALWLLLIAGIVACGDLERSNPFDPGSGEQVDTAALLIGAWSRIDAEANEVYTFNANNSVRLEAYVPGPEADPATPPDAVDRNAQFPQTLWIKFTGTYQLSFNRLELRFTAVETNDPEDPNGTGYALPPDERVVSIVVGEERLVMQERDGDRIYTRPNSAAP